jgi:hypothetical protein
MAKRPVEDKASRQPTVVNRWWVDLGAKEKTPAKRPTGPVGSQFFRAAADFDQEVAIDRLTDNNVKLLLTAEPPEGKWALVSLAETKYPQRELERVKQLVALPSYARGLVVDCGRCVRLLVTGTPIGERVLELTMGEAPAFDCWVHQEWVAEAVFPDANRALRAFRRLVRKHLAPESIAEYDTIVARA